MGTAKTLGFLRERLSSCSILRKELENRFQQLLEAQFQLECHSRAWHSHVPVLPSLPGQVNSHQALWQRGREALYAIPYFLLHLDGLIDL